MPSARKPAGVSAPKLGGGTVTLEGGVFEARFNMPVVHETVRSELAARRRGTASTKTRGEARGGGAKPWRQKGTGRARAGSIRAPNFAGGGVAFGPTPRHYTFKVNRKERRVALRSALSLHAGRASLAVFDASAFTEPSTAQAVGLLNDWDPTEPVLVVLGAEEEAAGKSFRNIARVDALPVDDVGVADVIGAASMLVSETALPTLVARAAKSERSATQRVAPPSSEPAAPPSSEPAAPPSSEPAAPESGASGEQPTRRKRVKKGPDSEQKATSLTESGADVEAGAEVDAGADVEPQAPDASEEDA
jgi:large subunit ribosomal protein L4